MKHFFHANACSPPPPKPTRAGGACLRLLLALMLALVPGMSWADLIYFSDPSLHASVKPTMDRPHLEVKVCFFDTNNDRAFFLHNAAEGSNQGPALYVDDQYICSPDWELAWPGSGNTGNPDDLEKERKYNGWWGNTYTKTINGVKYTVKFWDPRKVDGRFYVNVCVFMDKIKIGQDHTMKIKGRWKVNNHGNAWRECTWKFPSLPDPWKDYKIQAKYTDYKTVEISGALPTAYANTFAFSPKNIGGSTYSSPSKFSVYSAFSKGTKTYTMKPLTVYGEHTTYGPYKVYSQVRKKWRCQPPKMAMSTPNSGIIRL